MLRFTAILLSALLIVACGDIDRVEKTVSDGTTTFRSFLPLNASQNVAAHRVRLFILSGQSNMVRLDPETRLIPELRSTYPNDEIIVVKFACGGQPIRRWHKQWENPLSNDDWTPNPCPGVSGYRRGDIYDALMAKVFAAIRGKTVNEVYFFWAQGEADAFNGWEDQYETSLRGVLLQLANDLGRRDIITILAKLSDYGLGDVPVERSWRKVRNAQSTVALGLERVGIFNTDDLNGPNDEVHYTAEGYRRMAERFVAHAVAVENRLNH